MTNKARELYEKILTMELKDPEPEIAPETVNCQHKWLPMVPPIRWAQPGVKPVATRATAVCKHCGRTRTL